MDWLFEGLSDEELADLHARFNALAAAYSRQFDLICAEVGV